MIAQSHLGERVGVVPFQRDIAPIFAALDIVVHASTKREPFGRVVAEGMSAGRAVVAVGAGGILEQIEDGKTGLLLIRHGARTPRQPEPAPLSDASRGTR
jgi:glycosyltransferase involved in cell wall biosynthesis